MKILIVDVYGHIRSTGKITTLQYQNMKNLGHEVKVCYRGIREPHIDNPDYIKVAGYIEPVMAKGLAMLTGYEGFFHPFATKRLKKITLDFKPDIVQLNILHGYYINSCEYIQFLKDQNIAVSYAMFDEYAYMGKCPFSFKCNQFVYGCKGNCPHVKNYPTSLFFDRSKFIWRKKHEALSGFKNIVFVGTEWVANRARQSAMLKGFRIENLDEPINFAKIFYPKDVKYLRDKLHIPTDNKIIVTVAQLSDPRKGGKYVFEVAKKLDVYKDITFVFVGCDTAAPFECDNMIKIPFVKNQDELADFYSLGDLFICTSLADTTPCTCIEALGCGTPIAGFAEAGTPTVCTNKYGIFTPTYDIDALADVVLKAPKKTEERMEECRLYAVTRFSPNVVFKKLEIIYQSLLKKKI